MPLEETTMHGSAPEIPLNEGPEILWTARTDFRGFMIRKTIIISL